VPWLTGVIALALQSRPDLSEAECFAALRETGTPFMNGKLVDPRAFIERVSRPGWLD